MTTDRIISSEELVKHNTGSSCWIAVDGIVYDVTKFLKAHPGGQQVVLDVAGRDVTEDFFIFHKKEVLTKYGPKLRVGVLENYAPVIDPAAPLPVFDTYTPFAETTFIRGWKSPYFNESHKKFRSAIRTFMQEHIMPEVEYLHERGADPSQELFEKLGTFGLLSARGGPYTMPYVKALGIKLPGGISPDSFDYFHEMIAIDELYRTGSGGVSDGLGTGLTIGLPPVLFGPKELRNRIIPSVISGKVRCCLAITEPQTGSDVSGITTTAKLNPEGTHYIVNGIKKWITGSGSSSPTVYTTAVRTGGPGHNGISLVLIEDPKSPAEGTITKHKIKTSYSGAAGTSLLIFDNVLVPKQNLLGPENQAFKLIGMNFNHERWYICCISSAVARTAIAECYRWAYQRKAFGKRLIDQPVIRYKLAEMSAIAECMDSWIESLTYQMTQMSPMEQFEKLASPIALCKFFSTRYGVKLADNACQIFGGRAVTRTGMGRHIEAFKNEIKFAAILGGSEEILADLAVRQAVASCDKSVKKTGVEAIIMARL
jgi:alkylation response protein AidB-like acyl-CoA dehydrogenase/predicted heme/steroid binding protein